MEEALRTAQLWHREDGVFHPDSIIDAWRVMARVGKACRFCGRSPQGLLEYALYDPKSGRQIALGQGRSECEALCRAALAARRTTESA